MAITPNAFLFGSWAFARATRRPALLLWVKWNLE
jgi:hypothetical protein